MSEINTKVNTTPAKLFIVESLLTFRMRYLVESETAEGAEKVVNTQPDDEEWQQKFMGNIVLTSRPISREEASEIHAASDSPSSVWMGSPWVSIDSAITRAKDGI
jgi:hypothetical protein